MKKEYREILRSGDLSYKWGTYASAVNFILLDAPAEVLSVRVNKRAAEGKHYMPASLLQSQLDLLEIDESEGVLRVDATLRPQAIVNMHQFQGCSIMIVLNSLITWHHYFRFQIVCTKKRKSKIMPKRGRDWFRAG